MPIIDNWLKFSLKYLPMLLFEFFLKKKNYFVGITQMQCSTNVKCYNHTQYSPVQWENVIIFMTVRHEAGFSSIFHCVSFVLTHVFNAFQNYQFQIISYKLGKRKIEFLLLFVSVADNAALFICRFLRLFVISSKVIRTIEILYRAWVK